MSATLQDGAEAWGRSKGFMVPPRQSAAWRTLYALWQRHGMPSGVRTPNRSEASADILAGLGEQSAADLMLGARVSPRAAPVLEALSRTYGGGGAFTREQLAREARPFVLGAHGQALSPGSVSARTGHALTELERLGYVRRLGKELGPKGRPGPMRFVLTQTGEDRATAAQVLDAQAEGERDTDFEIARFEREALESHQHRGVPLSGETYRPSLAVHKTPGHKLPEPQRSRMKKAGYRLANPNQGDKMPWSKGHVLEFQGLKGDRQLWQCRCGEASRWLTRDGAQEITASTSIREWCPADAAARAAWGANPPDRLTTGWLAPGVVGELTHEGQVFDVEVISLSGARPGWVLVRFLRDGLRASVPAQAIHPKGIVEVPRHRRPPATPNPLTTAEGERALAPAVWALARAYAAPSAQERGYLAGIAKGRILAVADHLEPGVDRHSLRPQGYPLAPAIADLGSLAVSVGLARDLPDHGPPPPPSARPRRRNAPPKRCQAGHHDYDPVTRSCRRRGCIARLDEPGQGYLLGVAPPQPILGTQVGMFGALAPAPAPAHEEPGQGSLFAPRAVNPLSVLVLGANPQQGSPRAASTPGRPHAARSPRAVNPPPGTLGVREARSKVEEFHGAPVARWRRIQIDDGKPGVTRRALAALGLVPASVYRAPWGASNKARKVYEHDHEGNDPLEAYDPLGHVTVKFLEPQTLVTDWWREKGTG